MMEERVMQLIYGNDGNEMAHVYYKSFGNKHFTIIVMDNETLVLGDVDDEYELVGQYSSLERAMSWLVCMCVAEELNDNKARI